MDRLPIDPGWVWFLFIASVVCLVFLLFFVLRTILHADVVYGLWLLCYSVAIAACLAGAICMGTLLIMGICCRYAS